MKILHSEVSDTIGGIEAFLLNISSNIDLKQYQFDIITTARTPAYEKEFTEIGIPVYKISSVKHFFKYYKEFSDLLKKNQYDIVHIHKNSLANPFSILIARKYCKKIVIHSHNTKPSKGKLTFILHWINRRLLCTESFLRFACSEEAARWMYGQAVEQGKDYYLIKNGINVEKFLPNQKIRDNMRKELGVQNDYVLCNVGRFTEQKNHHFLIEIFAQFHKRIPKSKLVLVGTGPLLENIKKQVKELSLPEEVLFLGERKDIPQILQAADVFVLPSIYEGLGIAGIEAQAVGLPLITSDNVPKDINVTGNTIFLKLNESIDRWCDSVVSGMQAKNLKNINFIRQCFDKNGYNIQDTVHVLEKFYSSITKNSNN